MNCLRQANASHFESDRTPAPRALGGENNEHVLALARRSYVFLFFWSFLGAYLGLKIDPKIDASDPNRLEIEFPFDLDPWHRFSWRF